MNEDGTGAAGANTSVSFEIRCLLSQAGHRGVGHKYFTLEIQSDAHRNVIKNPKDIDRVKHT